MSTDESNGTWWNQSQLDRELWSPVAQPVIERVAAARDHQRLPQAVMLIGPPGLGRELAAVEAAALLTCPETSAPWCSCKSCQRVRNGIHPDVAAVMPQGSSKQIKIDQIRAVVEAAPGRPFEGVRRVWIIDGVEAGRLGAEAANAFLKTLEEPPEHIRFILLAANPEAVLPTIRSRCQHLAMQGVVAVARQLGKLQGPPELATAVLAGRDIEADLGQVALALKAGFSGEVLGLVRLSHMLASDADAFDVVAAGVLEMIRKDGDDHAEDLVRLAGQVLACNRRTQALNLNRERQLLACLLSWARDLALTGFPAAPPGRVQ